MSAYKDEINATTTTFPWKHDTVTNWSLAQRSSCSVFRAHTVADIMQVLTTARTQGRSLIAYGAGHSYTDAALNTNGIAINITPMRRILSWDPARGIMQVEPGATLGDIVRVALPDRWWPPVTPSTADATIGGCVAMNVNGKNAWKAGSFGEHLLSLTVLLASGQLLILSPTSEPELFRAFVGSVGLLGIITSVTLQLQPLPSGSVNTHLRPAACLNELIQLFQEEQSADYLEAWVDGFANERSLGRGIVIATRHRVTSHDTNGCLPTFSPVESHIERLTRCMGTLARPATKSGVHLANRAFYWWCKWYGRKHVRQQSLFRSTYYPSIAFTGYHALLPQGTETFQAFVPFNQAQQLFAEILRRSQKNNFIPLWCVIKQHRQDPFLLSYQVDGFSLEVNYQIVPRTKHKMYAMLREFMELVIAAGGRFYFAKDSLLTNKLYRRSIGDDAVEAFLHLKQLYDPEMLFQSDLFRRVFQASR